MLKREGSGLISWDNADVQEYHVTGVDRSGKRFKIVTKNWWQASAINVWRGTRWAVGHDGKRHRIQTIRN